MELGRIQPADFHIIEDVHVVVCAPESWVWILGQVFIVQHRQNLRALGVLIEHGTEVEEWLDGRVCESLERLDVECAVIPGER